MASPIRLVASWVSLPSINYNAVDKCFFVLSNIQINDADDEADPNFWLEQLKIFITDVTVD